MLAAEIKKKIDEVKDKGNIEDVNQLLKVVASVCSESGLNLFDVIGQLNDSVDYCNKD